jgi:hypothetical protein
MKTVKICKEDGCYNAAAPGRSRCYSDYGKRRRIEEKAIRPKSPDGKIKILMLDIETTPDKSYHWGRFGVNIGINQTIEEGAMVCFAAKWYGQDEIEFYSEWQHGLEGMVSEAWRLLDEAAVVVHFYGSRFDIPHINTSCLKMGFPPPSPFKQVDLKMVVGRQFKFSSNKLEFVSRVLGLEGKVEHEGFPLWDKLMNEVRRNGEKPFSEEVELDAKIRMEIYNKRDVFLLDEVYEALLPWIPNHPHRHLYQDGTNCPTCDADEGLMVDAGYAYTKLSKFKQFRCKACGGYFRSKRRESGVDVQESVL